MNKLELWEKVCRTDPKMTKPFDTGTYKGTQIDPQYQIKMATEIFGPFGLGWGVSKEDWERVENQTNETILLFYFAELWYLLDELCDELAQAPNIKGSFPITSGIKVVYKTRNGKIICDEDATKKLQTNAISKGLSRLGFSADVYLGKFDDALYVQGSGDMFGLETINKHDAEIVGKLLEQTKSDEAKFLKNFGVDQLGDLTQDQFGEAMRMLKLKVKKQGGK